MAATYISRYLPIILALLIPKLKLWGTNRINSASACAFRLRVFEEGGSGLVGVPWATTIRQTRRMFGFSINLSVKFLSLWLCETNEILVLIIYIHEERLRFLHLYRIINQWIRIYYRFS